MDDRTRDEKNSVSLDDEIKAFTMQIVQQRIDAGDLEALTRFADLERFSHAVGQRVARGLEAVASEQLTDRQAEQSGGSCCCPTCGARCNVTGTERTIQTIDGPSAILELKSHCPKCRRDFFPNAGSHRPR